MEEGTQFPKVQTKPSKRKKIKKEVKYQRLPKSIKKSLKSNIHWTMISVLYEVTEDYNENEKLLNILKERFLKCIETLEVPVDELNCLTRVQKILKEEEKKYILMEEELEYLEGEITKDGLTLNTMDEEMQTLQKKIKALKHELRTLKADTLINQDFKDDLALPGLPMEYFKLPPLQNEVLKIGNPQALLDDMNIIQQSDEMKNMMAFLEQLYEKADDQVKSDNRCTEEQICLYL
ncbi:centromere protein Q-like [Crotalus tigris]|uniref:centromere protein Q-like n=1 Tax=Crotalus tigris TaxID=88082 RepID=UPI00192F4AA0|nr:centromere protein Q-like [Crotalus tigris]XP_039182301.1 centromere protein Q-like [Crotalus tigris]